VRIRSRSYVHTHTHCHTHHRFLHTQLHALSCSPPLPCSHLHPGEEPSLTTRDLSGISSSFRSLSVTSMRLDQARKTHTILQIITFHAHLSMLRYSHGSVPWGKGKLKNNDTLIPRLPVSRCSHRKYLSIKSTFVTVTLRFEPMDTTPLLTPELSAFCCTNGERLVICIEGSITKKATHTVLAPSCTFSTANRRCVSSTF
jgi:hypothetical protein